MSYSNNMRMLLSIQDENITVEKDSIQIQKHQEKYPNLFQLNLHLLLHTVSVVEDYTIYKNDTKASSITLPTFGIYPTYLNLKKRFFCKACHSSFIASTSIVQKHYFISNHTKAKVLIKSTDVQSLTDIAKDCSDEKYQNKYKNCSTILQFILKFYFLEHWKVFDKYLRGLKVRCYIPRQFVLV